MFHVAKRQRDRRGNGQLQIESVRLSDHCSTELRQGVKMGTKVSKIKQKYLDLERIEALRIKLEEKLPPDSGLRLDVMIALSVLKECFKYGFVERVDE